MVVLPHPQEAFGFPGRKRLCEGFALPVGDQSEGAAVRQGVQSDGQSLFGTVETETPARFPVVEECRLPRLRVSGEERRVVVSPRLQLPAEEEGNLPGRVLFEVACTCRRDFVLRERQLSGFDRRLRIPCVGGAHAVGRDRIDAIVQRFVVIDRIAVSVEYGAVFKRRPGCRRGEKVVSQRETLAGPDPDASLLGSMLGRPGDEALRIEPLEVLVVGGRFGQSFPPDETAVESVGDDLPYGIEQRDGSPVGVDQKIACPGGILRGRARSVRSVG